MRQMLTDELLEHFAENYKHFVNLMNDMNVQEEDRKTFEEYVESAMRFRAFRLKKGGYYVEA